MDMSGHLHAPAALSGENSHLYSLDRLGEPHRRSGRGAEERNPYHLRESNLVLPVLMYLR